MKLTLITTFFFLLLQIISSTSIITSTPIATHEDSVDSVVSSASNSSTSPYSIIIDGGSTGSRLHIFEFKHDQNTNETTVERRGSQKVNIPLSHFALNNNNNHIHQKDRFEDTSNTSAGLHLLPLFQYASTIIPSQYHAHTSIRIQATAGMRLVEEEDQRELYNTIHESLHQHEEFVFDSFRREDIHTLDGVLEGLYGVVAVNYLKGVIDVHLDFEDENDGMEEIQQEQCMEDNQLSMPLGALDLGGASMQIVFQAKQEPNEVVETETCSVINTKTVTSSQKQQLNSHEFYSTSYLSYGSDQFRERLWDTWILDFEKKEQKQNEDEDENSSTRILPNPCSFKGYQTDWKGYTLVGTGDAQQCSKEVNRLIPHHIDVHDDDNNMDDTNGNKQNQFNDDFIVGGIEHPPINGEFYAMSLFFFVMDCVRTYTQDKKLLQSWPKPSIHELSTAIDSFCSKHWIDDLMYEQGDDIHQFTRKEILAERCFESVYIISLLRDGFGFDLHARDITYSFLVDGSEVEWSLGMAISLYAEENNSKGGLNENGNSNINNSNSNSLEEDKSSSLEQPSLNNVSSMINTSNDHDGVNDSMESSLWNHPVAQKIVLIVNNMRKEISTMSTAMR